MGPVWEANHVWLIFVLVVVLDRLPDRVRRDLLDAVRPAVRRRARDHPARHRLRPARRRVAVRARSASSVRSSRSRRSSRPSRSARPSAGSPPGESRSGTRAGDLRSTWLNPTSLFVGALAIAAERVPRRRLPHGGRRARRAGRRRGRVPRARARHRRRRRRICSRRPRRRPRAMRERSTTASPPARASCAVHRVGGRGRGNAPARRGRRASRRRDVGRGSRGRHRCRLGARAVAAAAPRADGRGGRGGRRDARRAAHLTAPSAPRS